jgi:hypothetical protein
MIIASGSGPGFGRWRAAALEDLDNNHMAATRAHRLRWRLSLQCHAPSPAYWRFRGTNQLPSASDIDFADGAGEQAVVADGPASPPKRKWMP